MGRQVYVPPPPVGEPVFELVERDSKFEYLYRFMSQDLCTVHKAQLAELIGAIRHPTTFEQTLKYRVVRSMAEPVGPLCNCPWMTHHPDEHCKHARLVRAAWAHWDALALVAHNHHRAALDISALRHWTPGDPPLPLSPPPVESPRA